MTERAWLWTLLSPFKSRKVQVALATIVATYLAQAGLNVSEEVVAGIIASGLAVILGIAIEDHADKR